MYGGPDAGPGVAAGFAAANPCPVDPGARPKGKVAAGQPLSPELVEWATASLTCHLNAEVPRLLPTAEYAPVPGAPAGPLVGFAHGGGNRVDALALIRDAEGTGDLTVMVGVADRSVAAQEADNCRKITVAKCTVLDGPDGVTVLLGTEADGIPVGEPRTFIARVFRGHSEIYVEASSSDRQAVNGGAPVATRPQPVLSADQAVQLALSPALYLFP